MWIALQKGWDTQLQNYTAVILISPKAGHPCEHKIVNMEKSYIFLDEGQNYVRQWKVLGIGSVVCQNNDAIDATKRKVLFLSSISLAVVAKVQPRVFDRRQTTAALLPGVATPFHPAFPAAPWHLGDIKMKFSSLPSLSTMVEREGTSRFSFWRATRLTGSLFLVGPKRVETRTEEKRVPNRGRR